MSAPRYSQAGSALNRKPRPEWLRAMGAAEPQTCVIVDQQRWVSPVLLKHDAFAATARYRHEHDPQQQIIVKFARTSSAFGVPFAWLGRWSVLKEQRVHQLLANLQGIPQCFQQVSDPDGNAIRNAWARRFIIATPLDQWPRDRQVPDHFFPALWQLVADAHAKGVAFVDLNKPDNLLVCPDDSAAVIDFQISTTLHERFPRHNFISRGWVGMLQDCDRYHLMKHWSCRRPDQLTEDQHDLDRYRPRVIRLWRRGWRPVILLRRRLLVLLKVRHGPGTADTEAAAPCATSQADAKPREATGIPATP